ncbi:MAG: hypothetical protein GTO54_07115 [Nitrososphaeria archaeon]|nr:hypothetical protein [Nitrososphaeria archaeon]
MNKKLLSLLLVPLMLMPLMGFAYAHWSDRVTKQIKLHAGTVEVDIVRWHIDEINSYDVSCDGIVGIWGDYPIEQQPHYDPNVKYEVIIEMVRDADNQVVEIYITADPVFPGWTLWFKMLIHNKGRLSVQSDIHHWNWIGPEDTDPCWLIADYGQYPDDRNIPTYVDPDTGDRYEILDYSEALYDHDDTNNPDCVPPCTNFDHYLYYPDGTSRPTVGETTAILKPCQSLLLSERITFNAQPPPVGIGEYVQCHWFRLAKELGFKQYILDQPWSSFGWTKPTPP